MFEVQYFARYREVLRSDGERVEGAFATVRQLRDSLLLRGDDWAVLAEQNIMCARNQELCSLDEPIESGDEVAFFPTVTGG
jgi:molybdopterin synthase sulfur carrier subunit